MKFDNITRRIRQLCDGLDPAYADPVPVAQKVIEGFFNGIPTSEVDTLAAVTCAYMSKHHPDFSTLAAQIAVSDLRQNTSDSFSETCRALHSHRDKQGRPAALLSDNVWEFISASAEEQDRVIDHCHDDDCNYFGFKHLRSPCR